eukprot:9179262-Pyramimonas_sp.AAC.1
MLALPALPSAGVLPTAGVAIFVRSQCGVRVPPGLREQVVQHRVLHVVLDLPGWPPLHAINLYL